MHTVRIIGGRFKRSKLEIVPVEGLRPTPDRVRETLFNWLGQDLSGWVCVDAFAGTGALGIEAASRNAHQVTLIESHPKAVAMLRRHIKQLNLQESVIVMAAEAVRTLQHMAQTSPQSLDLLLLDPPYQAQHLYTQSLMWASQLVNSDGFVYLESDRFFSATELEPYRLTVVRQLKAGQVHAQLLQAFV